jgi:hypothetical protein
MPNFSFTDYTESIATYDPASLLPRYSRGWDDYHRRLARYEIFDGYYHNMAYHTIVTFSEALRHRERLYKHVRGVYNPVMRLVELYVGKSYPGTLDLKDAKTGAVPIDDADDNLRQAIIQLWKTSRWQQGKSVYPRNTARFGDGFIKVVDNVQKRYVAIEAVDPRKVKHIETDLQGNITKAILEFYITVDGTMKLYTEVITQEKFTTFIQHTPAAVVQNGRGEPVTEWENDYGFVPLIHVKHRDLGLQFGAPSFMGTIHKINELNDLASIANDGARKQMEMPLVATGVKPGSNIEFGSDNSTDTTDPADTPKKDTKKVLNLPGKDADLKPIPPALDLANVNQLIQAGLEEIERDLPELALHRVRAGGNLTSPGVTASYDDAASRILEARGNFDGGLVEAQQMAIAIGGFRGYEGYTGYALDSRTNGDTDHRITERPVVSDVLSKAERIDKIIMAAGSPAADVLLTEMGLTSDEVKAVLKAASSQLDVFNPQSAETPVEEPEAVITPNDLLQAGEALV